jgi:hypothetical protein
MDYATLRKEGIRLLERMSGGEWTDFNAHDPGITLLEQLCYVLSDFAYRTGHAIPDLLAEQGQAPYASLHPPDAILSCEPVTQADLRRVVLDVEGVKNAWVEPMIDDAPAFYFNKSRAELLLKTSQLGAEPITPRGLHRVFIEPSGDVASPRLRALAAERLHACRSLGADLGEIIVLSTQPVQVEVTLEVNPIDNPQALLAQVRACLAEQIAPTVRFASLTEQLAAGQSFDTIYEGPLLGRGFTPADDARGAAPVVLLGHDLWQARYGGDAGILGRRLQIDDAPVEVVGVMPAGFRLPTDFTEDAADPTALWRPLSIDPATAERGSHGLYGAAVLAPGATALQPSASTGPLWPIGASSGAANLSET